MPRTPPQLCQLLLTREISPEAAAKTLGHLQWLSGSLQRQKAAEAGLCWFAVSLGVALGHLAATKSAPLLSIDHIPGAVCPSVVDSRARRPLHAIAAPCSQPVAPTFGPTDAPGNSCESLRLGKRCQK